MERKDRSCEESYRKSEGKLWLQRGSAQGETVVERKTGKKRINSEENKREGYDQEEGEE